jgi:hypothetical protein
MAARLDALEQAPSTFPVGGWNSPRVRMELIKSSRSATFATRPRTTVSSGPWQGLDVFSKAFAHTSKIYPKWF